MCPSNFRASNYRALINSSYVIFFVLVYYFFRSGAINNFNNIKRSNDNYRGGQVLWDGRVGLGKGMGYAFRCVDMFRSVDTYPQVMFLLFYNLS